MSTLNSIGNNTFERNSVVRSGGGVNAPSSALSFTEALENGIVINFHMDALIDASMSKCT